jgi:ketosteroid isomerase-like protein
MAKNATFESLYADLKKAVADGDTAAVSAMLDKDFVNIEISDMRQNGDQWLANILTLPEDMKDNKSETTILKVEIGGNFAHVTQRYHRIIPRPGEDGKIHTLEFTALSGDLWELHGKKWLIQESRTDEIEMALDGKQLTHQVRPAP